MAEVERYARPGAGGVRAQARRRPVEACCDGVEDRQRDQAEERGREDEGRGELAAGEVGEGGDAVALAAGLFEGALGVGLRGAAGVEHRGGHRGAPDEDGAAEDGRGEEGQRQHERREAAAQPRGGS